MDQGLRVGDRARAVEALPPSSSPRWWPSSPNPLKGTDWAKDDDLEEVLERSQHLQSDFAGNARVAELTRLVARAAALQPDKAEADNR